MKHLLYRKRRRGVVRDAANPHFQQTTGGHCRIFHVQIGHFRKELLDGVREFLKVILTCRHIDSRQIGAFAKCVAVFVMHTLQMTHQQTAARITECIAPYCEPLTGQRPIQIVVLSLSLPGKCLGGKCYPKHVRGDPCYEMARTGTGPRSSCCGCYPPCQKQEHSPH